LAPELDRAGIETLTDDDRWDEVARDDLELTDQCAAGVGFDGVRLTRVDLSGSRLDALRLIDAALTDCNLANLQSRRLEAARLAIGRSRLTGIGLHEGSLHDVTISGCRVDLASFGFSVLARVTFEDCLMTEASFHGAQLDAVRFHDCDLTRADFRQARLRRCEFRRTDLTDLEGVVHLRGAAIDWPTVVGLAGVWAAALGIRVLDTD
jgi:uncharacterized protein YjbI with pentapeptide repeats